MSDVEVIDILSREGLKRVHALNTELKAKCDYLALELEKIKNNNEEPMQSVEQDKLLKALALAKNEMAKSDIERSGHIVNRGSYATLDDIRVFVDPILAKYGLSFRTEEAEIGNEDYLRSVIGHESGQWYSSLTRIRPDYAKGNDALQAYAKALTSKKRYAYGAFFMLHTGGDKD